MPKAHNDLRRFMIMAFLPVLMFAMFGCANTTGIPGQVTSSFSWWNAKGENTVYYDSYDQNPVVEYLTSLAWNVDENGNDVYVDLEFQHPLSGSEREACVTMISTGTYTDIMDMSMYTSVGSVADLYEQGIALDLTDYVEQYMPNYRAFLEAHPEYAKTATNMIDGEEKYLQIYNYHDGISMWGGWCYRRDWILEYGVQPVTVLSNPSDSTSPRIANPNAGQTFLGGYRTPKDSFTWTDNIVFPSGNTDPVFISDWEWMLQIFEDAIEAEGIIGGYPMSLYYPGFNETGILGSAFGGGGGTWYLDSDGATVKFGATSDDFRTYLQCVNTWYDNGWIDEAFSEHTSDMFYQIDLNKIFQGKIGLFWAEEGTLDAALDAGESEYTDGICVTGARNPINDIYGSDEQKNVIPFCFYQTGLEYNPIIITDKAQGKDLVALCKMIDYMYGEEGTLLATFGLNQAQYEATQNEFMTSLGLSGGTYSPIEVDGKTKYYFVESLNEQDLVQNALKANRFIGLHSESLIYLTGSELHRHSVNEWILYISTGRFLVSLTGQMSIEDAEAYSRTQGNIREFLNKTVPNFVKGVKDPFSDADWNAFVSGVNKYKPETNTLIMQSLLDQYAPQE